MRLNRIGTLSLVCAVLITAHSHAQQTGSSNMAPGLWEITIQTRSPIVAAPLTHTICVDRAHAVQPEAPKSKKNDDCQVLPDPAASNQTAYTIRCAKKKVTSTSRFTYLGDHFDGTVSIKNGDVEIQQVYTGVRVGECEETEPAPPIPPPAARP